MGKAAALSGSTFIPRSGAHPFISWLSVHGACWEVAWHHSVSPEGLLSLHLDSARRGWGSGWYTGTNSRPSRVLMPFPQSAHGKLQCWQFTVFWKKVVLHIAGILMLLLPVLGCCNFIGNSNFSQRIFLCHFPFASTHLCFYLMCPFSVYSLHQISILQSSAVLHSFSHRLETV